MSDEIQARVHVADDGQLVLIDPAAVGVARAVAKANCSPLFAANQDRIAHFARRAVQLGLTAKDVVIVVANVDDPLGRIIADWTMPDYDWAPFRARGELPVARGLVLREGIELFLDEEAKADLRQFDDAKVATLVFDYGVCRVFA